MGPLKVTRESDCSSGSHIIADPVTVNVIPVKGNKKSLQKIKKLFLVLFLVSLYTNNTPETQFHHMAYNFIDTSRVMIHLRTEHTPCKSFKILICTFNRF